MAYAHKVLAVTWVKKGFKSMDGYLYKGKIRLNIYEEKDFFELLGLKWIEPREREI